MVRWWTFNRGDNEMSLKKGQVLENAHQVAATEIINRLGTCDRCEKEHKQTVGCVNWRPTKC